MPVVTGIRMVQAPDGRHEHIGGVCTAEGVYFSRDDVVSGIELGEEWWVGTDDPRARIRITWRCPSPGCRTEPYIEASPEATPTYELEKLAPC